MRLCFLHGLDSSPMGTKSRLLKQHYPQCLIPSLPPDIHKRFQIVEKSIVEPAFIIGSSLGGLTALMLAMKHPKTVKSLLLLAPAVGCTDKSLFSSEQKKILDTVYIPAGIPSVIIAGINDDVIPLASIRAMVGRSPDPENIELIEVDDDHNLHRSLDLMLQTIVKIKTTAG